MTTFRCCCRILRVPRTLHTRRIQKRQRVQLPEWPPAEPLGEPSDCWPESVLSLFQELVRLLQPVRSWPPLPAWESAARSAASLAHWSGWVSPSTKRSATKEESKRAEFYFPFTATHQVRSCARKNC